MATGSWTSGMGAGEGGCVIARVLVTGKQGVTAREGAVVTALWAWSDALRRWGSAVSQGTGASFPAIPSVGAWSVGSTSAESQEERVSSFRDQIHGGFPGQQEQT